MTKETPTTAASAATPAQPGQPFQALDACHLQIQLHLVELGRMAKHMESAGLDQGDRKLAGTIEAYVRGVA